MNASTRQVEAKQYGFLNAVVAPEELTAKVEELAKHIAGRAVRASPIVHPHRTPSTHGLFDFHFSSEIIPIVIPI